MADLQKKLSCHLEGKSFKLAEGTREVSKEDACVLLNCSEVKKISCENQQVSFCLKGDLKGNLKKQEEFLLTFKLS